MASNEALRIMFPPGRVVFIDEQDKNDKGEPLVDNKGLPFTKRTIGVAIPKGGEADWRQLAAA